MTDNITLPCPFCGHVGLSQREGSTFRWLATECNGCGAQCGEERINTMTMERSAAIDQAKVAAIETWNTRAAPPEQQQAEPAPIYYMRDNHTFKKLSAEVSAALVEIESEFNAGYTHGSLCSKRKGFPQVHASGSENRLIFFRECKTVLEKWADAPPQRKPLSNEQADQIIGGLQTCHHQSSKREFLKVWLRDWAAHNIKEQP